MSNLSRSFHIFMGIVAGGSENQEAGEIYGGDYYPAIIKPDGTALSARWQGTFFVNLRKRTNDAGQPIEVRNPRIRLTAWNGKNAGPTGGLADVFARSISRGCEIFCMCSLNQYPGEVWDNGGIPGVRRTRVLRPNGTPVIDEDKIGFQVIPNTLIIGNEASKIIQEEKLNGIRPPNWDNHAHPDHQIWLNFCKQKNTAMYQPGMAKFGHARVMGTGTTGNAYGASLMNPAAMAAATGGEAIPMVNGHPYEAYIQAGVTPEQMLQSPLYAPFHQRIMTERTVAGNTMVSPPNVGPTMTAFEAAVANGTLPNPAVINNMAAGANAGTGMVV